jgi:hypothetical protein
MPGHKFARYSWEAGAITHINMDRTAAEQTCFNYGMLWSEAEAEVDRALKAPDRWKTLMADLKGQKADPTPRLDDLIKKTARRLPSKRNP